MMLYCAFVMAGLPHHYSQPSAAPESDTCQNLLASWVVGALFLTIDVPESTDVSEWSAKDVQEWAKEHYGEEISLKFESKFAPLAY